MMYAFARDGALPKYFNHVNEKLQTPIRTIFLAITLSFILALPSLGSSVACEFPLMLMEGSVTDEMGEQSLPQLQSLPSDCTSRTVSVSRASPQCAD